jgi:hypothetical protein
MSITSISANNNPEINNILEGLVNLNYLIRADLDNHELVRTYLDLSDGQLDRLKALIQPLLH